MINPFFNRRLATTRKPSAPAQAKAPAPAPARLAASVPARQAPAPIRAMPIADATRVAAANPAIMKAMIGAMEAQLGGAMRQLKAPQYVQDASTALVDALKKWGAEMETAKTNPPQAGQEGMEKP